MTNLFKAIYTLFSAGGDFYDDMTGLYYDKAPQGTAFPYCTYHNIGNDPDYHFGGKIERPAIQFSIFDKDHGSALPISQYGDNLTSMFDDCALTIAGSTHIMFKRSSDIGPFTYKDRSEIYNVLQYSFTYEVMYV